MVIPMLLRNTPERDWSVNIHHHIRDIQAVICVSLMAVSVLFRHTPERPHRIAPDTVMR
jgi:hypothetical protein